MSTDSFTLAVERVHSLHALWSRQRVATDGLYHNGPTHQIDVIFPCRPRTNRKESFFKLLPTSKRRRVCDRANVFRWFFSNCMLSSTATRVATEPTAATARRELQSATMVAVRMDVSVGPTIRIGANHFGTKAHAERWDQPRSRPLWVTTYFKRIVCV